MSSIEDSLSETIGNLVYRLSDDKRMLTLKSQIFQSPNDLKPKTFSY